MPGTDRPATLWEGRPVDHWASAWSVPELIVYDSVPSTNDVARARAEAGAAAGLVVLTDHQSAGRGRLQRAWLDQPRTAVLLSFLMRPRPGSAPGTAPLRVGMAAVAALRRATAADVRLKWPNDLVVPGAGKVGGVLCEAVNAGVPGGYVIAGIGINVHAHPDHAADDYAATSLDSCSGRSHDRSIVVAALLAHLMPLRNVALDPLSAAEIQSFAQVDALHDAFVTIDGEPAAFCARSIDASGALIVERAGTIRRVTTATVRATQTVETP